MKTTTVRKLLPEAWGFLCPVHTPDGHPCGLLNHISAECIPIAKEDGGLCQTGGTSYLDFKALLSSLGMHATTTDFDLIYPYKYLPVILNGVILGYIDPVNAPQFVKSLRALKVQQLNTDARY